MDAAHIHLILNHFPIVGIAFSIPLLAYAWLRKNRDLGMAGLSFVVMVGLLTIPTFLSGEPAEELIEHLPGISENIIKNHEEAAEKAIWFVGCAAVAALISLILSVKKKTTPRWSLPVVTTLCLLSFAVLAWTANLGGAIRHPEIRADKSAPALENTQTHDNDD